MSLAQFDGDFAFCEPVTAHKETFVEVQAAGLTCRPACCRQVFDSQSNIQCLP